MCEPVIELVPRTFCRSSADCSTPVTEPALRTSLLIRLNAVTLLPMMPICELPSMKTVSRVRPFVVRPKTGALQVRFEPATTFATQPAATVVPLVAKRMFFSVTLLEPMNSAPRALAF